MSLRSVQRQAAQRYVELGTDLSASLRPQRLKHVTSDLPTTARLLRNSRLFSLPPPIPSPSNQLNASTRTSNESDTATAPFPTRAAIITPRSSLAKGDWGLKRPLPDKALKTTTPVIRLKANDTIDHITEFESASDHVFTLQKWQELDMPITIPRANYFSLGRYHSDGPLSAFDDSQDPKEIPADFKEDQANERGWGVSGIGQNRKTATRRWKYTSPWIAGMPAGEFEDYVRTTIKKRRVEFRGWLRQRLVEKRTTASADSSKSGGLFLESGLSDPTAKEEASLDASVDEIIDEVTGDKNADKAAVDETPSTDDTAADDILRLRSRQMDLFEHIWAFLDLPGRLPNASSDLNTYSGQLLDINQGPPQTHPSAGLSYLRPGPFLHNHAALGPMAQPPPVAARVLQRPEGPRKAMLGVAGVAVDRSWAADGREAEWRVSAIQQRGGPKAHVLPQGAHVDSHGRIHLDVRKAQVDQVAAWVGQTEEGAAAGGAAVAPQTANNESADSVFGGNGGNGASGSASLDSILMARRPAATASGVAEGTRPAARVPDLAALAKGAAATGAAKKE